MPVCVLSLSKKVETPETGKEDSYERNPGGVSFVLNHKFSVLESADNLPWRVKRFLTRQGAILADGAPFEYVNQSGNLMRREGRLLQKKPGRVSLLLYQKITAGRHKSFDAAGLLHMSKAAPGGAAFSVYRQQHSTPSAARCRWQKIRRETQQGRQQSCPPAPPAAGTARPLRRSGG